MAKQTDKQISVLLEKVEEKRSKLGKRPKASWNTNAVFRYDSTQYFNLNTVSDSLVLVKALAHLLDKSSKFKEAAARLGVVEEPVFEWNGYLLEDWEHDFKLRVDIVSWEARKKELEVLEKKLKSLVSEEAKTEMELADIAKLLG